MRSQTFFFKYLSSIRSLLRSLFDDKVKFIYIYLFSKIYMYGIELHDAPMNCSFCDCCKCDIYRLNFFRHFSDSFSSPVLYSLPFLRYRYSLRCLIYLRPIISRFKDIHTFCNSMIARSSVYTRYLYRLSRYI